MAFAFCVCAFADPLSLYRPAYSRRLCQRLDPSQMLSSIVRRFLWPCAEGFMDIINYKRGAKGCVCDRKTHCDVYVVFHADFLVDISMPRFSFKQYERKENAPWSPVHRLNRLPKNMVPNRNQIPTATGTDRKDRNTESNTGAAAMDIDKNCPSSVSSMQIAHSGSRPEGTPL